MGLVHIVSAYHKEGPGDGSLAFPWNPTTMLSLDLDVEEAKEIVLEPPVKCLHTLTGDRRVKQPKGPCNLTTDYYLVPQFESMDDRENQIIRYALRKQGIRLVRKTGAWVHPAPPSTPKGSSHSRSFHIRDSEVVWAEDSHCHRHDLANEESWSDDGVSADRGSKKKRFQWQPRIKALQSGTRIPGKREAELRSLPCPQNLTGPPHIHVVMTGGEDLRFKPSVGDIILAPPKRQLPEYRMPDGACVMTLRESDQNFKFKAGDLALCLGRYVQPPPKQSRRRRRTCPNDPPILYDPFASVTLYRYAKEGTWLLMGCHQKDDIYWVPETHDHLYSSGQDLQIGSKCPYGTVRPKLGDIIIRQGAWDEEFDHHNNYRRSLVKWWTPRFQFRYGITQGTVLIRPFIDRTRRMWAPKEEPHFYWGRVEMFVYRGQHAKDGWKYWGMDDHICDMPPFEPPRNVFHYVEDTDVDTGGPESEFRYRHELQEVWRKPGTFVDIQKSGYPL